MSVLPMVMGYPGETPPLSFVLLSAHPPLLQRQTADPLDVPWLARFRAGLTQTRFLAGASITICHLPRNGGNEITCQMWNKKGSLLKSGSSGLDMIIWCILNATCLWQGKDGLRVQPQTKLLGPLKIQRTNLLVAAKIWKNVFGYECKRVIKKRLASLTNFRKSNIPLTCRFHWMGLYHPFVSLSVHSQDR